MLFRAFPSHQQQLIIGNQTFQLPSSSPHQWYMYIASYNAHNPQIHKKSRYVCVCVSVEEYESDIMYNTRSWVRSSSTWLNLNDCRGNKAHRVISHEFGVVHLLGRKLLHACTSNVGAVRCKVKALKVSTWVLQSLVPRTLPRFYHAVVVSPWLWDKIWVEAWERG